MYTMKPGLDQTNDLRVRNRLVNDCTIGLGMTNNITFGQYIVSENDYT